MKVAIIDLGTNSVRFDVHNLGVKGKVRLLHREKRMIRLGQGVFVKGRLDQNAIDRAVHAFVHFRNVADSLRVRKIVAFGTSALREAHNSSALLDLVKESSGIEIKVISGKEEAKLIALGILSHEKKPKGRFGMVDIGGGSTEVSICRGKDAIYSHSFRLGTARLQQVFLKKIPPPISSLKNLRSYIQSELSQQMKEENWPRVEKILGSSGTAKAIAKILTKGKPFSVMQLAEFVEKISPMTTSQLLGVQRMEPKRVDMILSGAILLEEIAYALGAKEIIPTDFSLRDGIIEEEIQLSRAQKNSLIELHLEDLISLALRCGAQENHLRHMMDLSNAVFDKLKHVHKLENKWKVYLLSTIILRNTGEMISYAGNEKHSYYIVKNSDIPSMQTWEHEFIARLCLLHHAGKVESKDMGLIAKEKKRKNAFLKLLALVRVIDGFDLGPKAKFNLKKVKISRGKVVMGFSGSALSGIEQLMTDRKKRLFEDLFKRQLVLERLKRT